jgi:lipopolysaccharide transport system ATP-binding protein
MGNIAIRVEGLSKSYKISIQKTGHHRYRTLREDVGNLVRTLFARNGTTSSHETIWALRDVSFEIAWGEVVGIIGRNGAGKSTLLKILSRITRPSTGYADVFGRVGSLLEVGTGFHPELTGRENMFLSGAVLGMTHAEVHRKFDEIVDFAGIEKFLDTPVKRFSSGMYMRLAFAVAAHLEPEILVVDEVLAVGDAEFQKKCLGKMDDVAKTGRTVLFVSHNMSAVNQLCSRTILLNKGRLVADGPTSDVIEQYLQPLSREDMTQEITEMIAQLPADSAFRLLDIAVLQDGKPVNRVANGKPLDIIFKYDVFEKTAGLRVYFDLCDARGELLVRSFNDEQESSMPVVEPGRYESRASIPANLLTPSLYYLRLHGTIFNVRSLTPGGITIPLDVEATGTVNRAYPAEPFRGKLTLPVEWKTTQDAETLRNEYYA